jgi:hypothetical protein
MMRSKAIAVAILTIAAALAAVSIVNACEGNQVLIQDNFNTHRAMWGTLDDFHTIRNGKMLIAPSLNRSYMTSVYAPGHSLSDMDACVDVALARGGPQMVHTYGGLAFWVRTVDDFYELMIGPSGTFSVDRMTPSRRLTIVPFAASTAVKSGLNQVNRLRVTTRGNTAVLYINGIQVANITGQAPSRGGYVGLSAQAGPNTRDVYEFTNFKVTN